MQRRQFLKSTFAASGLALVGTTLSKGAEATKPSTHQLFELRRYHLRRGPMANRFEDYVRNAALPASNRAGVEPVGVFTVAVGPDNPTFYVLLPYSTAQDFVGFGARLKSDADYLKAGDAFINAPATDPPYVRVESSLMLAFDSMPKLELPKLSAEKQSRIFELRTYESHSKKANKTKIQMFNQGEIDIFRRVGINPVFFGETLIGDKLPNLTYMVAFASNTARDEAWSKFGRDEEWQRLRSKPGYADADIVSNISNVVLRPTGYSQV